MIRKFQWMQMSLVVTVFGLLAIPGCSNDGLDKRYAVTGKVTYKGQPVETGLITFIPTAAEGRGATGKIDKGVYSLTTQDPDDGAFPGTYAVTITAKATPDVTQATEKAKQKGNTAAYIPQGMTIDAYKKAPNAVPDKYGVPGSSNLKAEVKAQANTFDFDLTD